MLEETEIVITRHAQYRYNTRFTGHIEDLATRVRRAKQITRKEFQRLRENKNHGAKARRYSQFWYRVDATALFVCRWIGKGKLEVVTCLERKKVKNKVTGQVKR